MNTKLKHIILSLLCLLLIGNTAYAAGGVEDAENATDFFWSEAVPVPAYTENRDGTSGGMGFVIDGERIEMELPTYEEAIRNRVLVLVDGQYLHTVAGTGSEPFIENGRTMIPLRAIADAFGFEVDWEQSEEKITLTKDDTTIILYIGKSEILVDNETVYFEDAVPMIKNSRTFLPVRKLAEILGIQVEWDGDTRTATFTDQPAI